MALSQSLRFSPPPKLAVQTTAITSSSNPHSILPIKQQISFPLRPPPTPTTTLTLCRRRRPRFTYSATTENGSETTSAESDPTTTTGQAEQTPEPPPKQQPEGSAELSEVGEELKRMMKERAEKEGEGKSDNSFLGGVAEEVGKIEWPEFNKVFGITGVVLGIIAGSSVVLLTLNAVLAELSDKVFAGKGVQDFFG